MRRRFALPRLKTFIPNNPLFSWKPNYGLYPSDSHPVWERLEDLANSEVLDLELFSVHDLMQNLNNPRLDFAGTMTNTFKPNRREFRGWAMIPGKGKNQQISCSNMQKAKKRLDTIHRAFTK